MYKFYFAASLSLLAGTADAVVLNGRNYDRDVVFSGLSNDVFNPFAPIANKTFPLADTLAGWDVVITASVSDPDHVYDAETVQETLPVGYSAEFINSTFTEPKGLFFNDLLPGESVTFNFKFNNSSSLETVLDLAAYSGESMDVEVDKLTHLGGGILDLHSSSGLTSIAGDGTNMMTFTADGENRGEYVALTSVEDGDTIQWVYTYNGTKDGSNMIAFSVAQPVPLPGGAALLIPALVGLGWLGRRRKQKPLT